MPYKTTMFLAAAALTACLLATDAQARGFGGGGHFGGSPAGHVGGSRGSAFFNSPSLASPPPQQQPRTFVGPAPSLGTPMQRVQPVAPLATPPIR
jgi:DNA polymerase III subunit gamma/tau